MSNGISYSYSLLLSKLLLPIFSVRGASHEIFTPPSVLPHRQNRNWCRCVGRGCETLNFEIEGETFCRYVRRPAPNAQKISSPNPEKPHTPTREARCVAIGEWQNGFWHSIHYINLRCFGFLLSQRGRSRKNNRDLLSQKFHTALQGEARHSAFPFPTIRNGAEQRGQKRGFSRDILSSFLLAFYHTF